MAYVYRHIRLDKNEPFYIGIGSDKTYKRANARYKGDRNEIGSGLAETLTFLLVAISKIFWNSSLIEFAYY